MTSFIKPVFVFIKLLASLESTSLIRRFKSMNSLNTATSMNTSIDSIPSEVNQNDLEEEDFEIIEITRL